jgi:hypothetical protein
MTEEHYRRLRLRMVEEQLRQRGIREARVLDPMRRFCRMQNPWRDAPTGVSTARYLLPLGVHKLLIVVRRTLYGCYLATGRGRRVTNTGQGA